VVLDHRHPEIRYDTMEGVYKIVPQGRHGRDFGSIYVENCVEHVDILELEYNYMHADTPAHCCLAIIHSHF